eukprot:c1316_g1_i1.p1 GENE.c1316_g1_i1~~c1316_g1_i1.p1  ORF type:complete len:793 (+),score=186.11 c1316_g1_i1:50-2428(+)
MGKRAIGDGTAKPRKRVKKQFDDDGFEMEFDDSHWKSANLPKGADLAGMLGFEVLDDDHDDNNNDDGELLAAPLPPKKSKSKSKSKAKAKSSIRHAKDVDDQAEEVVPDNADETHIAPDDNQQVDDEHVIDDQVNEDPVDDDQVNEDQVDDDQVDQQDDQISVGDQLDVLDQESQASDPINSNKSAKSKKSKKTQRTQTPAIEAVPTEDFPSVVPGWLNFDLDDRLLQGLAALKFAQPTPIQSQCLPLAVLYWQDIIAAAETGSGKTLAFGLPILNKLLQSPDSFTSLPCLILAPTRELALQVKDHLVAVARFTKFKIGALVGGLAAVKQRRVLAAKPHIIVGTPGRVWDMISSGEEWLSQLSTGLRFLVLDEADRMIEKGYFQELEYILDAIYTTKTITTEDDFCDLEPEAFQAEHLQRIDKTVQMRNSKRQTFLFSATLAFQPHKKTQQSATVSDVSAKMATLMTRLKFKNSVKQVDLSSSRLVATGVTEEKAKCPKDQKDCMLYYLLLFFKGRTLVFVNAISNIHRITSLLGTLKLPVTCLHASMQQRQRLSSLDKFRGSSDAILVASDVAARGLDIPQVDLVIHYDVPKLSETYVHRCGRTARGTGVTGRSIAIVSPEDMNTFIKLCANLNRDGMSNCAITDTYLPPLQRRIQLAKKIEGVSHRERKAKHDTGWMQKMAKEMDIDLDEKIVEEEDQLNNQRRQRKEDSEVQSLKEQLHTLLSTPIAPKGLSRNYIATGKNPDSQLILSSRYDSQTKNTPNFGKKKHKKNRGKAAANTSGNAKPSSQGD